MSTHPDLGETPELPSSSTSTQHPDRDALADFSAGVLTDGDAQLVSAHVESCPSCADALLEIDSFRELLLADDPGPMPDDVWARIAAALESEATTSSAVPPAAVPSPSSPPQEDDAPLGGVTVLRRPTTTGGRGGSGRRVTGVLPTLGMAAGVAALLGGMVVAVQHWMPGADSDSGATADLSLAESAGARGFAGVVRVSGTDYRRASLQTQVQGLLAGPMPLAGQQSSAREPRPTLPRGAAKPAEGDAQAFATSAEALTLRDPAVLRQCLTGLGLGSSVPVAVDLAKFEGRDAALLVLDGADGSSYEVYAVSRQCGSTGADDGAFSYMRVAR